MQRAHELAGFLGGADLRSTCDDASTWLVLPASSSRWMRVSFTRLSPPPMITSRWPFSHSGSSNCEI